MNIEDTIIHNWASSLNYEDLLLLKNVLNELTAVSISEIKDVRVMTKTVLPILKEFSSVFQLEIIEQLSARIEIIEAKNDNKLLEGGNGNVSDNPRISEKN